MAHFKVEEKVLQTVLNYLQTKPFNEVAQLIQVIQQSQPIKEEVKGVDKKDKPEKDK